MCKKKLQQVIPRLTLPIKEEKSVETLLPNSEEDRIVQTPITDPVFLNNKLSLDYVKSLDNSKLKYCFMQDSRYNQYIFGQAVEQNEKKLVINILTIAPELINIKTSYEGHNILHKALMGVADEQMVEILLTQNPELIAQTDNENLTPKMFGEKYGFGKALLEKESSKMKEILENYEEKNTTVHNPYSSSNVTDKKIAGDLSFLDTESSTTKLLGYNNFVDGPSIN